MLVKTMIKREEIIIDDESYNCDKEEIQRTSSS